MMQALLSLGGMRLILLFVSLLCIVFRPDMDAGTELSGWGLFTTTIIPVVAPMAFMVLLLDAIMSRIFRADASDNGETDKAKRFTLISRVNVVMALAMLLSWLPFFLSLNA